MVVHLHGIVRGRRIDLDDETGLPDGVSVTVDIRLDSGQGDDLRDRIDRLCGAWADDPSIDAVFSEIASARR